MRIEIAGKKKQRNKSQTSQHIEHTDLYLDSMDMVHTIEQRAPFTCLLSHFFKHSPCSIFKTYMHVSHDVCLIQQTIDHETLGVLYQSISSSCAPLCINDPVCVLFYCLAIIQLPLQNYSFLQSLPYPLSLNRDLCARYAGLFDSQRTLLLPCFNFKLASYKSICGQPI